MGGFSEELDFNAGVTRADDSPHSEIGRSLVKLSNVVPRLSYPSRTLRATTSALPHGRRVEPPSGLSAKTPERLMGAQEKLPIRNRRRGIARFTERVRGHEFKL